MRVYTFVCTCMHVRVSTILPNCRLYYSQVTVDPQKSIDYVQRNRNKKVIYRSFVTNSYTIIANYIYIIANSFWVTWRIRTFRSSMTLLRALETCMYVIHMYVCMYSCMYVCMYVCTYVCMYVCVCVCMCVCAHVCVYVCDCEFYRCHPWLSQGRGLQSHAQRNVFNVFPIKPWSRFRVYGLGFSIGTKSHAQRNALFVLTIKPCVQVCNTVTVMCLCLGFRI